MLPCLAVFSDALVGFQTTDFQGSKLVDSESIMYFYTMLIAALLAFLLRPTYIRRPSLTVRQQPAHVFVYQSPLVV